MPGGAEVRRVRAEARRAVCVPDATAASLLGDASLLAPSAADVGDSVSLANCCPDVEAIASRGSAPHCGVDSPNLRNLLASQTTTSTDSQHNGGQRT